MSKYRKLRKKVFGSGGIRTHAPEETGALNQRLRPLGHATFLAKTDFFCIFQVFVKIPHDVVYVTFPSENIFLYIFTNEYSYNLMFLYQFIFQIFWIRPSNTLKSIKIRICSKYRSFRKVWFNVTVKYECDWKKSENYFLWLTAEQRSIFFRDIRNGKTQKCIFVVEIEMRYSSNFTYVLRIYLMSAYQFFFTK